jgi:UDP-glucose 4-epimerase
VVTGASGFIGRHLVARLRERGAPVIALARSTPAAELPFSVVCVGDYATYEPPADAVLVHLAEPPHIASVDREGERHVAKMRDQAAALLARRYARAIYVSSATVYGDHSATPRRPDESLSEPAKIYSQAKLAVEALFQHANGVVARATNIFGRGMSPGTIFGDIFRQLDEHGPIVIRETTPVRDYLWVEDAADALVAIATGQARGLYNLASGHAVSCEELAQVVLRLDGQNGRDVVGALPPRQSILRLDISSTVRDFNWTPRTTLESGIRRLLDSRVK